MHVAQIKHGPWRRMSLLGVTLDTGEQFTVAVGSIADGNDVRVARVETLAISRDLYPVAAFQSLEFRHVGAGEGVDPLAWGIEAALRHSEMAESVDKAEGAC